MNKIIKNIFLILLISTLFSQFSDYTKVVKFNVSTDRDIYRAGENIKIIFDFDIKDTYHIYSSDIDKAPIGGETYIEYYDSLIINQIGDISEPIPITKFDNNFNQNTSYHKGKFQLYQIALINDSIKPGNYEFKGTLYSTACDPSMCIRALVDFDFKIILESGEKRNEFLFSTTEAKDSGVSSSSLSGSKNNNELKKEIDKGLISFIIFSLGMGLIALLTPCVFPMIPITISFFTKLGESQEKDSNNITPLKAAIVYAIGIILIFTLLGLILALTLGASGAQQIAQNPWINLVIGFLFIFFAFSLFGYYELQAPRFLTQYSMKQESRSGYTGILFMALTFTLASFTCTAALVGTLLVAASQGQYFWPIVGMLSFATAFASPFFLLALFPQYLAKLPQSGGWLNSVKVIMGFLELAAAFKFISNSDLVWSWNIFNREVVLFIWAFIILLISFYILGLILFPHDSKLKTISNKRKISFIFTFMFSLYLSTGLFQKKIFTGNNYFLQIVSGLVESYLPPPKSTNWIEDLDIAYERAKELNRPIFLDFTGYTCTNCRWMEINIFEQKDVSNLFEEFVLVKLITDGKEKKHKEYRELEINRFKTAALPFYVVLSPNDDEILTFPGYDTNVNNFISFLEESLEKYKEYK